MKELTHFMPLVSFCTPGKYQKTTGFQGVQKETTILAKIYEANFSVDVK